MTRGFTHVYIYHYHPQLSMTIHSDTRGEHITRDLSSTSVLRARDRTKVDLSLRSQLGGHSAKRTLRPVSSGLGWKGRLNLWIYGDFVATNSDLFGENMVKRCEKGMPGHPSIHGCDGMILFRVCSVVTGTLLGGLWVIIVTWCFCLDGDRICFDGYVFMLGFNASLLVWYDPVLI